MLQRFYPESFDCEEFLGSAAALGSGITEGGRHHPLFDEAVERGVDSTKGNRPLKAVVKLRANRDAVRVSAGAHDRQKDRPLELTKRAAVFGGVLRRHLLDNVEEITKECKREHS